MQNDYDIEKIFEQIENDLISSMKRTLWSHKEDEKTKGFNWPQWQALKLKQLEDFRKNNQEIFKNYNQDIKYATKIQMKKQFREGASRSNKQAIKAGIIKKEDSQLSGSFFGLNDRKIKALMKSTTKDINDVKYATLRMANDQYRQIIYKAEVYANIGTKTVQQAIDMATHDFLARGFNCIEYKNGSRHNIADYCDMAIRTANKRANLMGEGEMMKKLEITTCYISKHSGACDKCSPWQGRVYIDDVWAGGKKEDGKYPLLSTAIEGGLWHPRCRHGRSIYYEGINNEPEEVTQAINNEHEDEYTQALQRQKRQYERLALGSLLPENVLNYQNKVNELQNQIESSKIEEHKVAQGRNLVNKWKVTEEEKYNEDSGLKRILKEQGFDGKPKLVDEKEFEKATKECTFFAQRTYVGKTIEEVKEYQRQLYYDDWYIDCSYGGAQYGKGMYCAATYDIRNKAQLQGITEEMKHYMGLNNKKKRAISIVEDITVDKSAKFIEDNKIRTTYIKQILSINNKSNYNNYIDEYEKILSEKTDLKLKFMNAMYNEKNNDLANTYFKEYNAKQVESERFYKNMPPEIREVYQQIKGIDQSVLAVEMGYDGINAKGHGQSGSYTVILNRTKLIIRKGGKLYE